VETNIANSSVAERICFVPWKKNEIDMNACSAPDEDAHAWALPVLNGWQATKA
jgi:hypothetical protein